ncbi:M20 aminoacylase family protein [Alcaligenaceae bacterium A4P071]|nr:M20 aminoacylase family protein [Alcaligenaceae bacterium A4P071]
MNDYLQRANCDLDDLVAIRRDIHAHPELGFEETRTAKLVADKLREWGIKIETGVGKLGVVGTIRGKREGAGAIGLRADMDALAMTETNALSHASTHKGVMHACGHDGHTTMLLGAARALARNPDFAGTVHVIFQPAEEGRGGALAMLEADLFNRFPCDRIYGLHSYPTMPVGQFGTRPEAFMAASGRWQVTFSGTGGHGGMSPHLASDITVAQANFVLGLQTIVSRNVPPDQTAIISVGHIQGGDPEAMNVMPATLKISGTMRAFSPDVQQLLGQRITEMAHAHAAIQGATATVKCWWNTAAVINDEHVTQAAVQAATRVVGQGAVDGDMHQLTAGEDFSWLMQKRPGAFVFIGNGVREGDGGGNLHMPNYDFNDDAIPYGVAYWLSVVDGELGSAASR